MEDHFYHITWAPLSVTIFITHERLLRNGRYANVGVCVSILVLQSSRL